MQEGLSCNWKKLQAKIQTGSTQQQPSRKRKSGRQPQSVHQKRPRKSYDPESRDLIRAASSSEKLTPGMGVSQSSKIEVSGRDTKTPTTLRLWAGGNDASAEDLAEAYRLGLKGNALLSTEKERVNEGLAQGVDLGKYVALDCEMVGVGPDGSRSVLARASVVDFHGRQVYDSFVRPQEKVTDWRTRITGIGPAHMKFARPFNEVQSQVAEILHDRILVGHDVGHDLAALQLKHSVKDTRDTAKFLPFRVYGNGGKPSLRSLSGGILGVEIQDGVHSSIEDARATMAIFRMHKPAFDVDHSNRFPDTSSTRQRRSTKEKSAPKKKKRIRKK